MAKYTRTQRKESTFCQLTMYLQLSKFISACLSVVSSASCPSFVCLSVSGLSHPLDIARQAFKNKTGIIPKNTKNCTGSHVQFGFNEHSTYQTNFSWLRLRPAHQKNMPISDERTTNKTVGNLSTIASSDKQNNMGLQTHRATTPKCRKPKSTQTHQPRNVFFSFYQTQRTLFAIPFQRKSRSKNRKITTFASLSTLLICLFLRRQPAFCTIQPFQFGCQVEFFQA